MLGGMAGDGAHIIISANSFRQQEWHFGLGVISAISSSVPTTVELGHRFLGPQYTYLSYLPRFSSRKECVGKAIFEGQTRGVRTEKEKKC